MPDPFNLTLFIPVPGTLKISTSEEEFLVSLQDLIQREVTYNLVDPNSPPDPILGPVHLPSTKLVEPQAEVIVSPSMESKDK